MKIDALRPSSAAILLAGALALSGLYLTSLRSYLLFHSVAEMFSIVVAFAIFVIFWNARRFMDNGYLLFVGIAFLFVGIVDLIHTLAYPGMGVFLGSSTNTASQLWIAARYLHSISLVIAPFFVRRKLRVDVTLVGFTVVTGLLLGAIFYWDVFPVCFVEGVGLTPFKVLSEYLISLLLAGSIVMLFWRRDEFDPGVLQLLVASSIVAIASEMAFTQYVHAYATANFIGHILKIASFYLIYKAVVETGLSKPYDLVFRDLKREEEALRASEQRYRELVESLDDVIYSIDVNGELNYVSPAVERFIGYTSQEMLGRPFVEFLLPDDIVASDQGVRRILSGEGVGSNEYRVLTKSGEVRWIRTSSRPVFEKDQAIGLRGVMSDITDQKRAEMALRESEEKFRTLAEQSPNMIFINRSGKIVYANEVCTNRLGYTQEEFYSPDFDFFDLMAPGSKGPIRANFDRHHHGEEVPPIEYSLISKVGRQIDAILSTKLIEYEGETAILGVATDITERKWAEERLTRITRDLEAVLNSAGDGIIGLNAKGVQTFVNPAAARILGYDQRELVGERSHSLWHHTKPDGTPYPEDECPIYQAYIDGVVHEGHDLFWRKDTSSFLAEYASTPIVEAGELVGAVIAFRDITERREAEEELRKLSRAVEQSPSTVVITNLEGNIEYVNPSFTEVSGYSQEEVIGKNPRLLKSGIHPAAMYSGLWRTIKAGGIWRGDLVNKKKNGEFYWERSAISSVKNSEGDTTHFIKVAEDVTERKRAEEAMRESEARLELAIAGSDGGLWDIALNPDDPTRALPDEIMLSPRLKSFIGYANGELPNSMTAWESHIPDEDLAKLRESSRLYREGQIDQYDLEYRIRHRDGSLRWLHTCGRVERNEDGHPIRFAGIDWDITERKQVEESLLKAKETAEIAQQVAEERQQEAERRREVAESLAEIMSVLNSNQPLSDVLDYITGQAGQMLGNDAAAIYHVDAEGRLSIRAVQDLPATYVVGKQAALGHQVLEEAMVSGKAIAETAPDIIPASDGSTAEHAEGETLDSTLIDPYRAMLTAPIALGDEPYGAIALYYLDAREFTTEDTELVAVFADQIGLAIENSRLRDEVREAATIAERERLARDLHDAVTQTLFSASLIAETLPRIWERDPERAEEGLEELRQLTQGALAEMRTLLLELRPASLTEKPLGEILGHLTQAVTSRSRIPVTLSVEGHSLLPAEQQISLYRIAQEALNNVAKHAAATEAFVRLSCESRQVELSIRDNGRGFDAQEALPDQLGLSIMQERAETIGAALTIDSDASQGTTVTVVWEETAGGRSNG